MSGAPVKILIAALGGEGGGVLASWITDAAVQDGWAAQRTSVPGVAQRTGGTTYYIELVKGDGRRPVLALSPAPGQVDLFISSELLETARIIQSGFVTPDRTLVISPTHRVFTIHEKIAMGDGRADVETLTKAIGRFSKGYALDDFSAVAQRTGAQLNAVLLGLAARRLAVSPDAFRAAIRADGRAVEANLRGFEAGLAFAAAARESSAPAAPPPPASAAIAAFPPAAHAVVEEGVRRLTDFQDAAYAQKYLARLGRFPTLDAGAFTELARHLAVRMSSEDVVRVAQLKLREARLARVNAEAKARPGDLVEVTEFLKPGFDELFSILPAGLARRGLAFVERRGWAETSFPMRVRTTGFWGFLRLRLLAGLRFMRPRSLRAAEENAWIERWLSLIERAHRIDPEAAREIIESASLARGYGDTWKRGHANWARIADEIVEPMLAAPSPRFADAVLQARIAANADPEGKRLAAVIESLAKLKAA